MGETERSSGSFPCCLIRSLLSLHPLVPPFSWRRGALRTGNGAVLPDKERPWPRPRPDPARPDARPGPAAEPGRCAMRRHKRAHVPVGQQLLLLAQHPERLLRLGECPEIGLAGRTAG